jgi:hypothetical protein
MTVKQFRALFPKAKRFVPGGFVANPRYRDPVHFQLRNPAWLVCQGWITTENGPEHHSWLEYGGIVLDHWFGYRMPIAEYYKTHRARKVSKFTKVQCRNMMDVYRRYGPWVQEAA